MIPRVQTSCTPYTASHSLGVLLEKEGVVQQVPFVVPEFSVQVYGQALVISVVEVF